MQYIGLYGYEFTHKAIAATHAVHKVKHFGFVYKIKNEPLCEFFIAVIQQLEVCVTSEEAHYRLMEAISGSNIKELKIDYSHCHLIRQMVKDISAYSMHNQSLKELVFLVDKQHPSVTLLEIKMLICNTSLKKLMFLSGMMKPVILSEVENLQKFDDVLEEINKH